MTDYAVFTNHGLAVAHRRIQTRQSKIAEEMIAGGFGHLRPSDMRKNPDAHPLAREALELFDEARAIRVEADLRYGPCLPDIGHLVIAQGGGYRRVKPSR